MRSPRGRALAAGAAVVAVYAASAALSGHLSPLARRPLLDGLVPPTPYRWVEPPPELIGSNEPPEEQTFDVRLTAAGSETTVLTTDDAQVSVILAQGAFAADPEERSVEVLVEPLAPSAFEPPQAPLRILGNVYRLEATYRPSGDPASLATEARVVLTYPSLTGIHGGRTLLFSGRGQTWRPVETNDLASILQADGVVDEFGYVAIAGSTAATASPSAGPADAVDGGSPVATIAIVVALLALVAGAVAAVRPWASSRPAAGAGRGSRRGSSRSGSRSSRRG